MKPNATLDQWLSNMQPGIWETLPAQKRLEILQELENIMAKEQGRKPLTIRVISPEEQSTLPGVVGYFDGKIIALSHRYFEKPSSRISSSSYCFADAVNTVLHEGRHAWQHCVADSRPASMDPAMLAAIQMNCNYYINDPEEAYSAQLIELDARRYARTQFHDMVQRMKVLGMEPDTALFDYEAQEIAREEQTAVSIQQWFTEIDMQCIDIQATVDWLETYPDEADGVDIKRLSMFEETKKLVSGKISPQDYARGAPLALPCRDNLQFREREKVEKFSFEDSFWEALGGPDRTKPKDENPDGFSVRPIGRGKVF